MAEREPLSDTAKVLRGFAFLVPILLSAAFASRAWVASPDTHNGRATVAPRGGEMCVKLLAEKGMWSPERCERVALGELDVPVRRYAVGAMVGGVILAITVIVLAVRAGGGERISLRFGLGATLFGSLPIVFFLLRAGGGIRRGGWIAAASCIVAMAAAIFAHRAGLPRQPELPPKPDATP